MIAVLIPFLSGKTRLILKDYGDGTKEVYFEEKEKQTSYHTSSEAERKVKNWKDLSNADKLQELINLGFLETYNTKDVKGLKLTKYFKTKIFMSDYETAFGSVAGFCELGGKGVLFTVRGIPLNYDNFRQFRDNH